MDNVAVDALSMRRIRDNLLPGMEVEFTCTQEMWLNTRGTMTEGTMIEEHGIFKRVEWEQVFSDEFGAEWEWQLGVTTIVDGSLGHATFDPEGL